MRVSKEMFWVKFEYATEGGNWNESLPSEQVEHPYLVQSVFWFSHGCVFSKIWEIGNKNQGWNVGNIEEWRMRIFNKKNEGWDRILYNESLPWETQFWERDESVTEVCCGAIKRYWKNQAT